MAGLVAAGVTLLVLAVVYPLAWRWNRNRTSAGLLALAGCVGKPVRMWCVVPRRDRSEVEIVGMLKQVTIDSVEVVAGGTEISSMAARFQVGPTLLRIPVHAINEAACEGKVIHLRS
jgi:hypothetical protein